MCPLCPRQLIDSAAVRSASPFTYEYHGVVLSPSFPLALTSSRALLSPSQSFREQLARSTDSQSEAAWRKSQLRASGSSLLPSNGAISHGGSNKRSLAQTIESDGSVGGGTAVMAAAAKKKKEGSENEEEEEEEGGGNRRSPQLLPLLRALFDDYQNDHRSV